MSPKTALQPFMVVLKQHPAASHDSLSPQSAPSVDIHQLTCNSPVFKDLLWINSVEKQHQDTNQNISAVNEPEVKPQSETDNHRLSASQ